MNLLALTCSGCCCCSLAAIPLVGGASMLTGSTAPVNMVSSFIYSSDAILGYWDCTADFGDGQDLPFTMELEDNDGVIEGGMETGDGEFFEVAEGSYDSDSGELTAKVFSPGDDDAADFNATFEGSSFEGEVNTPDGQTITVKGTKAD